MCIKKVACGLQKVKKEDGREVLEPIFVEVDCPEDMHRITSKIDSCRTITPKIVEENIHEVEVLPSTIQNEQEEEKFPLTVANEQEGKHVAHGGATVIDSPIGNNNDSPITDNDSPTNNIDSPISIGSPNDIGSPREVVCIETGEVFVNATQAGKAVGTARQNITACCKGKRKKAGGYHWQYL